ncbi:MAG: thiamine-binding protein [Candidatus Cyclobacteriaceae bacterium M3_2C_046]
MIEEKVNIALQILPRDGADQVDSYQMVDKAIEVIHQSGLKYQVCPFETVLEGTYQQCMEVVERAQQACFAAGADQMMVYIKIQRQKHRDVRIEDKMEKYQ